MNTASIVASAVGSISANITLSDSIKNGNNGGSGSWLEYDILKIEINKFSSIDDKLNYLRKLKFFDFNLPNKESLNRAIDIIINELEYKREQEYYNSNQFSLNIL